MAKGSDFIKDISAITQLGKPSHKEQAEKAKLQGMVKALDNMEVTSLTDASKGLITSLESIKDKDARDEILKLTAVLRGRIEKLPVAPPVKP